MKRSFWLVSGMIALMGVSIPGIASAQNAGSAGVVTAVQGHVTVARLSAPPQPLKLRDPVFWRDVVEARRDGVARVVLGGKTTVTVRELSRLELREEQAADGVRYRVELLSGKVRVSVARMLMRTGEQVEVRTRNAVASVRGTDFIVEVLERPASISPFGLLEGRGVGQGSEGCCRGTVDTVVTTLSGVVEVSSRRGGTGRVERVRAYEAVRVSGTKDPVRIPAPPGHVRVALDGLTLSHAQRTAAESAYVSTLHGGTASEHPILRPLDQVIDPGQLLWLFACATAIPGLWAMSRGFGRSSRVRRSTSINSQLKRMGLT